MLFFYNTDSQMVLLQRMEIRLLRTFATVARLQNFSAAARELNTVQPAVSRQISDLEEELGVSLFSRTTRQVTITKAGDMLLREAQDILEREARAKDIVKRAGKGQTGLLRIGYISAGCLSFLPGLVQRFSADFPELQLSLKELTAQEQVQAFDDGRLDIGFSRPLPSTHLEDIGSELLYEDTLAAFVPSTHALADKSSLKLADLQSEPFILFDRMSAVGMFDQIISACHGAGYSPEIARQPLRMQSVLTEVACCLGVSIAPQCVRQLNMTGCRSIRIRDKLDSIPLEVHYQKQTPEASVAAFVDLTLQLRSNIQQLMKTLPSTAVESWTV